MKTETQIAEENIELRDGEDYCISHKASCQRFLEFLEDLENRWGKTLDGVCQIRGLKREELMPEIDIKITDLKNTKKKYDEAGI